MLRRTDKARPELFKRFKASQNGVTAVEFALVGGPFLYLLCVIFETGIMLFSENAIESGIARAARMIRTGQAQAQGMTAADFKNIVCGNMAAYLKCNSYLHIDVRRFTAFADIDLPDPIDGSKGAGKEQLSADVTTSSKFEPGGPMDVVVVRAYYEWHLFVPGISQLANLSGGRRLLTGGAAFRNEPFPA